METPASKGKAGCEANNGQVTSAEAATLSRGLARLDAAAKPKAQLTSVDGRVCGYGW